MGIIIKKKQLVSVKSLGNHLIPAPISLFETAEIVTRLSFVNHLMIHFPYLCTQCGKMRLKVTTLLILYTYLFLKVPVDLLFGKGTTLHSQGGEYEVRFL